jgi:basic membrane lipoprotein Med (substrate-binding protein (PBP1-ABC) superfamily)
MRLPGRWVWLGLAGAAVAGVAVGLVVSGVGVPWSSGGRSLPPVRARAYENVDACLLTGSRGLADPVASQVWAGMEDASRTTTARVSYLAVTGPSTEADAVPFVGSLLVRGCRVIVASGAAEQAAVLADAGRFPQTRFIVTDAMAGRSNVTALAFATNGLRAAVAAAVESGVHAAGG